MGPVLGVPILGISSERLALGEDLAQSTHAQSLCGSGSYLALPELDGLVRDAQDQLHLVWGVALSVACLGFEVCGLGLWVEIVCRVICVGSWV